MNLSRRDFIKSAAAALATVFLPKAKEVEAESMDGIKHIYDPVREISDTETYGMPLMDYGRSYAERINEAIAAVLSDPRTMPGSEIWYTKDSGQTWECDTLPECEDCQEFLDDDTAELGRIVFVTGDGDDENDGLSFGTSKRTVHAALDWVDAQREKEALCVWLVGAKERACQ